MIKWILFVIVISLLVVTPGVVAKSKPDIFQEITTQTPFKLIQPIIGVDLLPQSGKELLTMGVDEQGQRWIAVYLYDQKSNQFKIASKLAIPKPFLQFDLSEYQEGSLQQLYFMTASALFVFEPQANKFSFIADIDSIYLEDKPQFISRGSFVHQWFGQQDNILITGFNQISLLTINQGKVVNSQTLPIKPTVSLSSDGVRFNQKKFYLTDTNFDAKDDLILVGDGSLIVYQQQDNGNFSAEALLIKINSSISGVEWWTKRDEMGNQLDQTDLVYRKLEELRDLNNDGIPDMVVRFTKNSGVLDRSNDYEVFLGINNNNQLSFSAKANSVIRADGTLTGLQFVDIDNDNKMEVLLAGFDIGLSQIIGALLSGSIDQDVFLFKMDGSNNYGTKPKISKEVELNFSISSGQSGSPVVQLADINGDGLKDLILSNGDDQLRVYMGNKGKRLFAKRSKKFRTQLPQDSGSMIVEDINGDGKEDLIIKHSKLDDKKLQQSFKVYIAI